MDWQIIVAILLVVIGVAGTVLPMLPGVPLVFAGLCNTGVQSDFRQRTAPTLETSLHCYPVPFSSELSIEIKGVQAIDAQVLVVNTLGQTVAVLHHGSITGDLLLHWRPGQIPSGIYFLHVAAGGQMLVQKIVLER